MFNKINFFEVSINKLLSQLRRSALKELLNTKWSNQSKKVGLTYHAKKKLKKKKQITSMNLSRRDKQHIFWNILFLPLETFFNHK